MPDRATFRIAGALTQVDKKFTKKEGKPFAVVWLEDVTGQLEVVLVERGLREGDRGAGAGPRDRDQGDGG